MVELTPADYSLLSWVQQSGVSAHAIALRFHHDTLIANCQAIEDAMKLWDKRDILQMPGKELCFRVNDTFYIGATMQ